jgi:endo-1,4-beta-D-glucanase Y
VQSSSRPQTEIQFLPVTFAAETIPQAPHGGRLLARRAMVFSAVAGLGAASMGVAVYAANVVRSDVPATPPAALSKSALPLFTPTAADRAGWAAFKAQMISSDGRIIDTGNNGESHSEGQGVGLLFAAAFDDQATFDLIFEWTKRHLLRSDGLHAWRWLPHAPVAVPDTNNATDGDIYIAGALQRAARRWQRPDYADAASRTARAIHNLLLEDVGGRVVLLPAYFGFVHPGRVVVNLSYYVFPLIAELDAAFPSPRWDRARQDGVAMIEAGRYGRWSLPPDWLEIHKADGTLAPAESFPQRFAWDAVRIPLFLAWAGEAPEVVQAASAFWSYNSDHPPAWVDLQTGVVAEYAAPPGIQAIAAVAAFAHQGGPAPLLPTGANDTYYSAALTLLARMALGEEGRAIANS